MENPFPRPMTLGQGDPGLFVHYSATNSYGVRYIDLYEDEITDNWLITEIRSGRYTLYKIPNTSLFQAIKRTTNPNDREIIELTWTAEIDRPLADDQLTIAEGEWTLDEYPGVAEAIRWNPMPPPRLAMPTHPWFPNPSTALAHALLPNQPTPAEFASLLLAAADAVDTHPLNHWHNYDLGIPNPEPITAPLLLATNCYQYSKPSIPPPQKRVADLMIADAVAKGECCSITMNPLTPDTAACVAPCYHVFEREAIHTWLATKSTCPTRRQPCSV
jgi:hypothetical protein